MELFIKLLLAHFIGDFLFQPTSWVLDKERKKHRSTKLYLHMGIHALTLALMLQFALEYWLGFIFILSAHYIIDLIKLSLTGKYNASKLFLLDQLAHVLILAIATYYYKPYPQLLSLIFSSKSLLILTAVAFITFVSSIIIRVVMSQWALEIGKNTGKKGDPSLAKAGTYIGILERLFVFAFVITNHWEGIGFLIAAKSVFRFSDLKEAQDRKLTEYILIGTLLSFGIAFVTGLCYLEFSQ